MAKKDDENCVPRQKRYFNEMAGNQSYPVNITPVDEINSNAKFPMPKPKTIEECRETGEYVTFSHTNGKG